LQRLPIDGISEHNAFFALSAPWPSKQDRGFTNNLLKMRSIPQITKQATTVALLFIHFPIRPSCCLNSMENSKKCGRQLKK